MATLAQLNAFITYLNQQWNFMTIGGVTYGQPYVWGAQHTQLTPSNYISVIDSRESDPTNRRRAKAYCKRLFDAGATVLYAYDCSGLGMYFWQNLEHEFPGDMTADGMMRACTLYPDTPKRGWWVFKLTSTGRAYHVGYMVDNTHVVEAYGRSEGVIKTVFSKSIWKKWGIPKILKEVIPAPGEPGQQIEHYASNYLWAPGGNYFWPPH